jgi:hypothetical protein
MAENPSGSGTKEKDDNSEDLMEKLGLCEDDLDDVVFEDEVPPINEGTKMYHMNISCIIFHKVTKLVSPMRRCVRTSLVIFPRRWASTYRS